MITLYVGLFFILLAIIFAVAARSNPSAVRGATPASKARRRLALIFALVGLGLVSMHFVRT